MIVISLFHIIQIIQFISKTFYCKIKLSKLLEEHINVDVQVRIK